MKPRIQQACSLALTFLLTATGLIGCGATLDHQALFPGRRTPPPTARLDRGDPPRRGGAPGAKPTPPSMQAGKLDVPLLESR
jgi:hypothetical protein